MMNRPLFILILVPVLISCSSDPVVMGEIVKKVSDGDSIFFVTGNIDEKYFAEPVLSAEIRNQEFELPIEITYPQMYKTVLKSDRPEILYSGGFYFLDMGTPSDVIDTTVDSGRISDLSINQEYNDHFPGEQFKMITSAEYQSLVIKSG